MFIPEEGSSLTVDLPGERLRATVVRIVGNDIVFVQLDSLPLTRNHSYKKDDICPARRVPTMLGEIWQVYVLPDLPLKKEKSNASPARKSKHRAKHKGTPAARPKAAKRKANLGNRTKRSAKKK